LNGKIYSTWLVFPKILRFAQNDNYHVILNAAKDLELPRAWPARKQGGRRPHQKERGETAAPGGARVLPDR